ncbi:hypothetical protein TD95_000914 [Thielaviopsis punctulata]|uniref:Major facilitator superfamily (MFS) profile domain-containing protein n=1 Tax=Thielaviopsis punctulata TaxID=72032 RepID=A0A0F4ZEC7_9PEZI|nr:hypothetical protein TD95_000914 [Thielaviopsis punctulata]
MADIEKAGAAKAPSVSVSTKTRPMLAKSHAHASDIPGTVNLAAIDGETTGYGQALFPVPAQDPNDPLQWPQWKKNAILVICSIYSFLGNSALVGPSVYISTFAELFDVSEVQASHLVSYSNLAFGFSALLLVPMYHKFGRRPIMLLSLLIYTFGLLGAARATSYSGLMAARIIHSFGAGVCEAIPVQLVNDIFFLHERGTRLGYYTMALCLGATGPLYAGYMLGAGYSWRLFFYVEFAFAAALTIASFLLVEETYYVRKSATAAAAGAPKAEAEAAPDAAPLDAIAEAADGRSSSASSATIPPRRPFTSTLKVWGVWDHDSDFFIMMARSFTYFLVPHVFWVVTTYGIFIGLSAFTFNYTFPLLITAPPYNWPSSSSGLIAVGTITGYFLALPFFSSSDRLAARLTRKNGMVREAEMRLGVMLPAMVLSPAGLILYGLAAEHRLHWITYFIGVAMSQFAAFFFFTFTLAYAIDSYTANVSEMLIAMNLGKQAISFGMSLNLLAWILDNGYAVTISGIFGALVVLNNLALIPFMVWGKRIRIFMARTWLAKVHRDSIREVGATA